MYPRTARSRDTTQDAIADSHANVTAITKVLDALSRAVDADTAVQAALDAVKESFGWAYGSYWHIPSGEDALVFGLESGEVGAEFRRVTLSASFREGVGLSGRTWRDRDLVFCIDTVWEQMVRQSGSS